MPEETRQELEWEESLRTIGAVTAETSRITVAADTAMALLVRVVGLERAGPTAINFVISALARRKAGGATALVGAPSAVGADIADAAINTATAVVTRTGNDLSVVVTGVAAKTIDWHIAIEPLVVAFAG